MPCGLPAGGTVKKAAVKRNVAGRILFLAYCALMLWLLFGQRYEGTQLRELLENADRRANFVPFETVRLYLRLLKNGASESLLRHAVINLVGNVVMFVPLGWLLPAVWERLRGFFKTFLLCAAIICLVEAVQYATALGSCDIDDLILNLIGATLGYAFWRLTRRK